MRYVHTALVVLFAVVLVVFCVQNLHSASVTFLGWSMDVPFPILAILIYVLGMLTGWSVWSFLRRSIKEATRKPEGGK